MKGIISWDIENSWLVLSEHKPPNPKYFINMFPVKKNGLGYTSCSDKPINVDGEYPIPLMMMQNFYHPSRKRMFCYEWSFLITKKEKW
jgi:hypothetical protein